MKVVIEETATGWYWKFIARNGRTMAVSGFGRTTRRECLKSADWFVAVLRVNNIKCYEKGKYVGELAASYGPAV